MALKNTLKTLIDYYNSQSFWLKIAAPVQYDSVNQSTPLYDEWANLTEILDTLKKELQEKKAKSNTDGFEFQKLLRHSFALNLLLRRFHAKANFKLALLTSKNFSQKFYFYKILFFNDFVVSQDSPILMQLKWLKYPDLLVQVAKDKSEFQLSDLMNIPLLTKDTLVSIRSSNSDTLLIHVPHSTSLDHDYSWLTRKLMTNIYALKATRLVCARVATNEAQMVLIKFIKDASSSLQKNAQTQAEIQTVYVRLMLGRKCFSVLIWSACC